jgi:Fe2+ transport system protein FeoA
MEDQPSYRNSRGRHFIAKLYAMGIVPDAIIIKKSASLMKGPIVIEKTTCSLRLDIEMAQGIIVGLLKKINS